MKVILDTVIVLKWKQLQTTTVGKEIEASMLPLPGVQIEDSAWKDTKVPTSTICNIEEGCCLDNLFLQALT